MAKEPEHAPHVLRGIQFLDDRIANPAYGLLLVLGLAMVWESGIPFSTFWIAASLGLYVVMVVLAVAGFTPALRQQIALAQAGRVDSDEYRQVAKTRLDHRRDPRRAGRGHHFLHGHEADSLKSTSRRNQQADGHVVASSSCNHNYVPDLVVAKNAWVGVGTSPKQHQCPEGVHEASGKSESERENLGVDQHRREGRDPYPAEGYVQGPSRHGGTGRH